MTHPLTMVRRLVCAVAVCTPIAWAAAADIDRAAINVQHETDRKACMDKTDPDSQRACLREAGAVRQDALRGRIGDGSTPNDWRRNALARCGLHKEGIDRTACERMVNGEGDAQGSVDAGGVMRQITTVIEPGTN